MSKAVIKANRIRDVIQLKNKLVGEFATKEGVRCALIRQPAVKYAKTMDFRSRGRQDNLSYNVRE